MIESLVQFMTQYWAHISAGSLLGLAGGLHCAAMCGGLTSAAMSLFSVHSKRQGLRTLFVMLLGRIVSYAGLGVLAAWGAGLLTELTAIPAPSKYMALLAALALMWIGFSTAGLIPSFSGGTVRGGMLGHSTAWLHAKLDRFGKRFPTLAPFSIGLSWGLAPCPLLYAALFLAMLTGTAVSGAMMMIGFGIGTVPAVVMAALGLSTVSSLNLRPFARMAIGIAIAGFGFATVYFDLEIFEGLCITS